MNGDKFDSNLISLDWEIKSLSYLLELFFIMLAIQCCRSRTKNFKVENLIKITY